MKDYSLYRKIGDMILFDPVTGKGKKALNNLSTPFLIDEKYFFDNLYIKPLYEEEEIYVVIEDKNSIWGHQYILNPDRFRATKDKYMSFKKMLRNDEPNSFPLIMMGTAGNGKSTQIQYFIYESNSNDQCISAEYFDFEDAITQTVYLDNSFDLGSHQIKNPEWLAAIVILDTLFKDISDILCNENKLMALCDNFNNCFAETGRSAPEEREFFSSMKKCYDNKNEYNKLNLFNSVISFLKIERNDALLALRNLLNLAMIYSFCLDITKKSFVVLDNLETYITVNDHNIPIPNRVLSEIYNSTIYATNNLKKRFSKEEEFWMKFKIVVVLRRTSVNIIQNNLHNINGLATKTNDYTGYFNLWEIWERKKSCIWKPFFENKIGDDIPDNDVLKVLDIIDVMMVDRQGIVLSDNPYQSLIAELMNISIRRNARSQAYAAVEIFYKIYKDHKNCCISEKEFYKLISYSNQNRYMLKAALLEIQFDRMVSSIDCIERNKNLHIVYADASIKKLDKLYIKYEYNSEHYPHFLSMTRRVLAYLSHFIEEPQKDCIGFLCKDIYATKSLYDLMGIIFRYPSSNHPVQNPEYKILAEVLTGLGNTDYHETKTGPFVILNIDDESYVSIDSLTLLLERIHNSQKNDRTKGGIFEDSKYSIRLTNAGHMFLHDIQPSFSYASALFCNGEEPLFFLKDIQRIKAVITTVYLCSDEMCKKIENETEKFCGSRSILSGYYYPNEKNYSFRLRVQELHIAHLDLYRAYINNDKNAEILGMTDSQKTKILSKIQQIRKNYKGWRCDAKCF